MPISSPHNNYASSAIGYRYLLERWSLGEEATKYIDGSHLTDSSQSPAEESIIKAVPRPCAPVPSASLSPLQSFQLPTFGHRQNGARAVRLDRSDYQLYYFIECEYKQDFTVQAGIRQLLGPLGDSASTPSTYCTEYMPMALRLASGDLM